MTHRSRIRYTEQPAETFTAHCPCGKDVTWWSALDMVTGATDTWPLCTCIERIGRAS